MGWDGRTLLRLLRLATLQVVPGGAALAVCAWGDAGCSPSPGGWAAGRQQQDLDLVRCDVVALLPAKVRELPAYATLSLLTPRRIPEHLPSAAERGVLRRERSPGVARGRRTCRRAAGSRWSGTTPPSAPTTRVAPSCCRSARWS